MGGADGRDAEVGREVETRGERERQVLHALHAATRDLMSATDEERIATLGVEAASEVLGFPGTGIRFHDPEREVLTPAAVAGEATAEMGERQPFPVATSPHGEAFRTDETVLHEVQSESPYGLDPFEWTMYVPLGDHGVLSLARRTGRYSRSEVTTAEILGRNVTAALDRAERERRLRERERRLERERRRLDEFAGVVSHDLRNPLGVATGRVQLAREAASDEVDDHLAAVERAHDRMNQRIEEVLALAREGRIVGDPEQVELPAAVREAWQSVHETDGPPTLRGVESLGSVEGDPERVRALFENLFRNAVEHGSTEGTVTVTVGHLPDDEGFYVTDDGPGIPEADREHVFESGYTDTDDGTGFGLAIVRSIVEAHGWSVRLTESESGGARFEVGDVA